jgi:uncharacterized zinc-type alcohol dehydrogenase-like protein
LLGLPDRDPVINVSNLALQRRTKTGSFIGGIRETQEMLDYCGEHDIVSDIEMVSIQDVNSAFERMTKGDVKYRFVIDISTLRD